MRLPSADADIDYPPGVGVTVPESTPARDSLRDRLDRIETALQRVMPGMNWLEWVSDEGEPALADLRVIREVVEDIPDLIARSAVIGAKHSLKRVSP